MTGKAKKWFQRSLNLHVTVKPQSRLPLKTSIDAVFMKMIFTIFSISCLHYCLHLIKKQQHKQYLINY